jgi:hypothetical protein
MHISGKAGNTGDIITIPEAKNTNSAATVYNSSTQDILLYCAQARPRTIIIIPARINPAMYR